MKQPKVPMTPAQKGASKQKKQLLVLGLLSLVLLAVVGSQFSGDDDGSGGSAEPTAAALENPVVADAAGAQGASVTSPLSVPDNVALSAPGADVTVERNPFESFWNSSAPIETTVQEIPAPSVTLNGTMVSSVEGGKSVAVIDGKTRLLGDLIQGWRLVSIGSREIGLESPTKSVVSVQMPLLNVAPRRVP